MLGVVVENHNRGSTARCDGGNGARKLHRFPVVDTRKRMRVQYTLLPIIPTTKSTTATAVLDSADANERPVLDYLITGWLSFRKLHAAVLRSEFNQNRHRHAPN